MTTYRILFFSFAFLPVVPMTAPADNAPPRPLEFRVVFDKAVSAEPFTGRVYILLSAKEPKELAAGPNWFKPEPFFAVDVKDWRPGAPLVVGADALGFPTPLARLAAGPYYAQAVMDFDRGGRSFSAAEGNGYSRPVRADIDPRAGGTVALTVDQVYHARPFPETDRVKVVDVESKLLTAFHGQPTHLRAGVVLPESFYKDPYRRYPVVYEIPGFGGTHLAAVNAAARRATDVAGVEMLYVVVDPSCRLGHHVFADSANNGPCGRALVEELIPFIEKEDRGLATPNARFVTGHSSGGWSSLWLQITYPDFFGGVWSTSPDPVDFRDFQRIDLTQPGANLFTDAAGGPRPLARAGGKPVVYFKSFSDMETVMGRGGQLGSFEAVFGPRGADGRPRPLWDRATGAVDPETARSWEKYDIRLKLERNWRTLGPKLPGQAARLHRGRRYVLPGRGGTPVAGIAEKPRQRRRRGDRSRPRPRHAARQADARADRPRDGGRLPQGTGAVGVRAAVMERRAIEVRGIVQGVGFRPFVYNLAVRLRLGGFVRNQTGTLRIEIEGEPPELDRFLAELAERPPPLARIEHVSWEHIPPCGEAQFRIESSEADPAGVIFISPDVAVCADCLAELFDPADRRYGYPFLNCTNCGPRLTIITGAPYDRPRTTMAGFPMCAACRAEYDDPADRRFHAQPTACAGLRPPPSTPRCRWQTGRGR